MRVFGMLGIFALAFTFTANAQTKADAAQKYNDGVTAYNAKNYAAAITAFKGALDIAAKVGDEANDVVEGVGKLLPMSYLQNSLIQAKTKNYTGAVASVKEAIAVGEKFNDQTAVSKANNLLPQLYRLMGNQELGANNFEKAIEYYRVGLQLNPDATNSLLGIGLAYSKMNKLDSSLAYFDKCIEVGKRTNKLDEVEKATMQARDILLEMASAEEKNKNYEAAIEEYNDVLKYAPQSEIAYYKLAFCNYSISKWDEAEVAANKALEYTLNPTEKGKIYFMLAGIGEAKKDIPMACDNYTKAQVDPKYKAQAAARKTALKCQ